MPEWRPSATVPHLQERAELVARIRDYFVQQGVGEVTTPVLTRYPTAEPALRNLVVEPLAEDRRYYLRSSPESAMKRLLAAGSGDIYQLGPVFRGDEAGRLHLPEFTMLEWYRLDFDHHALMDDVESLLIAVHLTRPVNRITYAELWERHLDEDPNRLATPRLAEMAVAAGLRLAAGDAGDRSALYDSIYALCIEPELASEGVVFIYDFPAELRAYARLSAVDVRVAERFELIIDGIEIANGYHEVTDADEQRACFEQDNALRARRGLPVVDIDRGWLDALAHGFPACAGVALGVERLHMALAGMRDIAGATSFSGDLV